MRFQEVDFSHICRAYFMQKSAVWTQKVIGLTERLHMGVLLGPLKNSPGFCKGSILLVFCAITTNYFFSTIFDQE